MWYCAYKGDAANALAALEKRKASHNLYYVMQKGYNQSYSAQKDGTYTDTEVIILYNPNKINGESCKIRRNRMISRPRGFLGLLSLCLHRIEGVSSMRFFA